MKIEMKLDYYLAWGYKEEKNAKWKNAPNLKSLNVRFSSKMAHHFVLTFLNALVLVLTWFSLKM